MKVKQFIGPFSVNEVLNLNFPNNANFVKIGIEYPHSIPISENITIPILLSINGIEYAITEKDILEFENLNMSQLVIIIKKINSPYFIIDIAYE